MIRLDHVTTLRQGRPTLDDISWQVNPGEHWAIVGPNGAGKSTLLSLCAMSSLATMGQVFILGHQVGTVEVSELRKRIGYVTAHHLLEWPLTARDIVLTAFTNTLETPMRWEASAEQIRIADAQLKKFGLTKVADTTWRRLSQGELGRTMLARATLFTPELLLLDEPAAGLDLAARELVLDVLAELQTENPNITTVMITHHLEELPSTTTHAALMREGKIIAQGKAVDVLTSENVTKAFDSPITVDCRDGRWTSRSAK